MDRPDGVEKLLAHRDELLDIDALPDDVGWRHGTPEGTVQPSGDRALVDEVARRR